MGYKAKRYRLVWEDGDLEGLEVVMKPASLGQMLDMQKLQDVKPGEGVSLEELEPLFRWFAGLLISWNVEDDDDQPVPATYEGVLTQDPALVNGIIAEFSKRVTDVDPTSLAGSKPGPPAEASLDLAASSRSLAS